MRLNVKVLPILLLLGACRTAERPRPVFNRPPASTAEACAAIRDWFEQRGRYSVSPRDVTDQCRMRISAGDFRGAQLRRYLEEAGWIRDAGFSKAAVPKQYAYETPSTRCTFEEVSNYGGDDRLHGGVGVSGGSSGGIGVGIGIGMGSRADSLIDFKMECKDRR